MGAAHTPMLSPGPAVDTDEPKKKKGRTAFDPNAPPPEPLDSDKLQQIISHLEMHGGTMLLGRLTTAFPGLKKAQLDPHLTLCREATGNGEWSVCLTPEFASLAPQFSEEVMQSAGTEKAKARKKERKAKGPDAPPPPALDEAM